MKTWKLVSGILSIILFLLVILQSCAVGVVNIIVSNDEASGAAGILVAVMMLAGGITSIAVRKSGKGGDIAVLVIYGIGALSGYAMAGSYKDLLIWSTWCMVCALLALISLTTSRTNRAPEGPLQDETAPHAPAHIKNATASQDADSVGQRNNSALVILVLVIIIIALAVAAFAVVKKISSRKDVSEQATLSQEITISQQDVSDAVLAGEELLPMWFDPDDYDGYEVEFVGYVFDTDRESGTAYFYCVSDLNETTYDLFTVVEYDDSSASIDSEAYVRVTGICLGSIGLTLESTSDQGSFMAPYVLAESVEVISHYDAVKESIDTNGLHSDGWYVNLG